MYGVATVLPYEKLKIVNSKLYVAPRVPFRGLTSTPTRGRAHANTVNTQMRIHSHRHVHTLVTTCIHTLKHSGHRHSSEHPQRSRPHPRNTLVPDTETAVSAGHPVPLCSPWGLCSWAMVAMKGFWAM